MQIAVFGLGKMGMQIAKRLHNKGFSVFSWNRGQQPRQEFQDFISTKQRQQGSWSYGKLEELINIMPNESRIFWLMLPHEVVEEFLFNKDFLGGYLKPGDIVIDGGNSHYKKSIERGKKLKDIGVQFFDVGVSGGVWGYENGFALMAGGDAEHYKKIEPILKALSAGENYGLVGPNGAGHFVKMVHNGIEYGMMEAIGEGYGIMKESGMNLDLLQVTKIYQEGTVVRSWLIDLVRNIFEQEDLENTKGEINMLGEGEWTVEAGKELGVDVRVIEDSVNVRKESKLPENQNKFSNKIVSLLRKQFGGHGIKQ